MGKHIQQVYTRLHCSINWLYHYKRWRLCIITITFFKCAQLLLLQRMSQIVAVGLRYVINDEKCAPNRSKTGKKCFSLPHFELLTSFIIIISFIILILPLLLSLIFWQNTTLTGVNCGTNAHTFLNYQGPSQVARGLKVLLQRYPIN